MKVDIHIHSKYSYDSVMQPKYIIKFAKLKGLSVISITDHNSMNIYLREFNNYNLRKIKEKTGIIIIKGIEVKTNFGDVIGLFLEDNITSRDFFEVVDQIRDQDGIVVLPHPYRRSVKPENIMPYIDIVEVLNGRSRNYENTLALKLAEKYNKPTISGSDAHIYWEIGKVYTKFSIVEFIDDIDELKRCLLKENRIVYGHPLPFYLTHGISYAVGRVKRKLGDWK